LANENGLIIHIVPDGTYF